MENGRTARFDDPLGLVNKVLMILDAYNSARAGLISSRFECLACLLAFRSLHYAIQTRVDQYTSLLAFLQALIKPTHQEDSTRQWQNPNPA